VLRVARLCHLIFYFALICGTVESLALLGFIVSNRWLDRREDSSCKGKWTERTEMIVCPHLAIVLLSRTAVSQAHSSDGLCCV
jgi:hypothetical protein